MIRMEFHMFWTDGILFAYWDIYQPSEMLTLRVGKKVMTTRHVPIMRLEFACGERVKIDNQGLKRIRAVCTEQC